jgi:cytochrome P450
MGNITDIDDDMLTPDRVADPYPFFDELRTNDPIHWSDRYRAWFISRWDDVFTSLRDPRFSSDRVKPVFDTKLTDEQRAERKPTFDILQHWMVFNDPPDHTRLRGLVNRAFTPRAVEALRPRIDEVVTSQLELIRDRGSVDLIRDFAFPIPAVVIAEMMGVPADERDLFKDWSDSIMALVFGAAGVPGRREQAQQSLLELAAYLRELVLHFRADPGENLISDLIGAQEADDRLSDDEIVSTCVLVLFGGHETTTNLIGNGVRSLLHFPDQLERLRSEPALLASAVEELLRFDGPSKMEVRMAAAAIELRGHTIEEGDQIYFIQAAANRDPEVFEQPNALDLARSPNRHCGFGFGIHYCMGAPIARLEGSIAIDALIRALPGLRIGPDPEVWHPTLISRGMQSVTLSGDTRRWSAPTHSPARWRS